MGEHLSHPEPLGRANMGDAAPNFVREMVFADLYLGHPVLGNRFSTVPKAPTNPVIASPTLKDDLDRVQRSCIERYSAGERDFRLIDDDVTYRVTVMDAIGGVVFVLRKMEPAIRPLSDLGIPRIYKQRLLERELVGLMLIVGTMNSGKTTTAGSIVATRLTMFGGVAVTAEDPIELPLEGEHGDGICFQTPAAPGRGGYASACRNLMRSGANIIYLGEIRDGDTAVEALRAGVNGHLVISTLHAEDINTALLRLQAMASERFDLATSRNLLADGLCCVFHQKLSGDPRRIEAELLMLRDDLAAPAIIRGGHFERLRSEIEQQKAELLGRLSVQGRQ